MAHYVSDWREESRAWLLRHCVQAIETEREQARASMDTDRMRHAEELMEFLEAEADEAERDVMIDPFT